MGVGTRFSGGGGDEAIIPTGCSELMAAEWITRGASMWACVRRRARACAVCLEVVCVSARERPVKITPRLTDGNLHAHSLVRRFSFWFLAAPFSRLSGIV